jgi:hypothetical protein
MDKTTELQELAAEPARADEQLRIQDEVKQLETELAAGELPTFQQVAEMLCCQKVRLCSR